MQPHRPHLQTLHVTEIELPREFEQLYELAYNLWWTWTPEARELFALVDGVRWAHYRNPVQLLINVEPRHWYRLLAAELAVARGLVPGVRPPAASPFRI